MDTATISPTCIAALVDEEGRFAHVSTAATDLAAEKGARLLLYDISSASAFREPVASEMSAEGVGEEYGPLLSDADLETLGHHDLAEQVRQARGAGVDAWGRLASDHGAAPFLEFADDQGADLILVSAELEDPGIMDRLRRETLEDTRAETSVPVVPVDRTGRLGSHPFGEPESRLSCRRRFRAPVPATEREARDVGPHAGRRAGQPGAHRIRAGGAGGGRGPAGRTCPDLGASHGETPGVERERTTGQPPGQSRWAMSARGRGGGLKSNASRKSPAMRSLGPRGGS